MGIEDDENTQPEDVGNTDDDAFAEENFLRGYEQALSDLENIQK